MGFCTFGGKRFSMEVKEAVILSSISEFKALNLELILESMREVRLERRTAEGADENGLDDTGDSPPKPSDLGGPASMPFGLWAGNVIILGSLAGEAGGKTGGRGDGEEKKSRAIFLTSPNHPLTYSLQAKRFWPNLNFMSEMEKAMSERVKGGEKERFGRDGRDNAKKYVFPFFPTTLIGIIFFAVSVTAFFENSPRPSIVLKNLSGAKNTIPVTIRAEAAKESSC